MMFSQFWSIFRQFSSWKGGQDTPLDPPPRSVEKSFYFIGERESSQTWKRRWAEVLEQVVLLHQQFSHSDRKWVKYAKLRHILRPRRMYTKKLFHFQFSHHNAGTDI